MIVTFLLALTGPLAVWLGLIVFKNAYLTFLLYHGLVCIGIPAVDILIFKKQKAGGIRNVLGLSCRPEAVKTGLCLGFIFFAVIAAFFRVFNDRLIDVRQIQVLMAEWNIRKGNVFSLLIIMTLANSILEEIYWRGYIYGRLMKSFQAGGVIFITSFFYASYHFITTVHLFSLRTGIFFTAVIFLAGLLWGFLRCKLNSLLTPIISHLMADAAIMAVYLLFIQRQLTG
jgi:membrane protease YdiL (CAAX protease family)